MAELAYAPSSACGRGCLPKPGTMPAAPILVQAWRLLAIVVTLVAGIAVALSQPLLPQRLRARSKRAWFRMLLRSSGVRLDLPTVPVDDRGTLFAANHVSWLDIPAVLAVLPMRVVAKDDVRRWPVIGLLAARGGTLFIDRRRLRRLPGTIAAIAGTLRRGQPVLVFPEGSTRCGRVQGRFYPATFQAAVDAGAAVRPVSLRYRGAGGEPTTAAAFVGDDTLFASVRRVVAARDLVVELEIGPAIAAPLGPMRRGQARRGLATATAAAIAATTHPSAYPHPHLVGSTVGHAG
jgi:1-acyl-sn-glycerol-3-phosphate acyltransferase